MSDFGARLKYTDVPVEAVLDCPMAPSAIPAEEAATVREYLGLLFTQLWEDGEDFDSKRPLGSGGWQDEIYRSLGAAGIIEVAMEKSPNEDEPDEYLGPTDYSAADELVIRSIRALLLPKPAEG